MLKKFSVLTLSFVILYLATGTPAALAQTVKGQPGADKARAEVQRLGVGPNARVEIKLQDKTKLKGYVSAVGDESVTVTDEKSGAARTVAFAEVAGVKKPGRGLSTKAWIIVGAVAAGAVITFIAVKPMLCDGGAQSRFPC